MNNDITEMKIAPDASWNSTPKIKAIADQTTGNRNPILSVLTK